MTVDGVNNYPLTWPLTWPRTEAYKRRRSHFANRSISKAVQFLIDELRMLEATEIIISTNLQIRADGLPKSSQRIPTDPGVAVYFILKGQSRVLACDKWSLPEENLWAIGKHIEALRGQQRWGVGTMDQAFAGYDALPAPKVAWWEILGVDKSADRETIYSAYRKAAMKNHPDTGGDNETFLKVQAAWEQVKAERNWQNH